MTCLNYAIVALVLTAGAAPAAAFDDLLFPEQAFRLSASADGDVLVARWDIADGYYMYRDRFRFRSPTAGVTLGEPEFPRGTRHEDEFFGESVIYRDRVEVRIPVSGELPDSVELVTTSQGCADAGLCYPPQTVAVDIPLGGAPPATAGALAGTMELLGGLFRRESAQQGFLPVEQAFQADARAIDGDSVMVRWIAADGYYLYRDKFDFRIAGDDTVRIEYVDMPRGSAHHDEFFGDTEVFYGTVDIRLSLARDDPAPRELALDLDYQGCADAGLCYPPDSRRIAIRLPDRGAPATAAGPGTVDARDFVSEQDRLAALLDGEQLWLVVLTFFGLGVLLTLTPCVLPMVPILSGIIVGQGPGLTARRGFMLSLVYVLAMAATYTTAGVLAGLLGQNLQAVFQRPAVLVVFAAVFVLLALAMFGFYRLEMPRAVQSRLAALSNRQEAGTWIGVAVMGVLSALIVGPCVAAPLAGALIYIGQTGDALLGGVALFSLSLGMGTLLLVIGASAGRWVPKAGPWMNAVKAAFGVLLLAVAIWLLERVLAGAVTMTLWAALAVISATYLGALEPLPVGSSGWRRLWKGLGLLLLAWGVLLLIGAASGGRDALQPLRGSGLLSGAAEVNGEALPFDRIKSVDDLERELMQAGRDGRTVMLDFYADWCVSCKEMERYTFPDPVVRAALAGSVLLKADVTRNDADDRELMRTLGILGPPSILFFGPDGIERRQFRVVGFVPADEFAELLDMALHR